MSNLVTIIIPVYADWPSLKTCIMSLIENVDQHHKIVLVNDNGPDADLLEENIKHAIKEQNNFLYFRNSSNLGFVGTCNRAVLELDKTNNNILLLNSDTKVTPGFLEEMIEIINIDKKIGALSPRTNNATLATIPLWAAHQKGIEASKSYKIFQKIKDTLPRYSITPVAHGYCMLIRRSLIKKYGLFDEVFGKGYGEEVDFCQRIKDHGFLSALANRAYVFHLEARSFTHETKARLIEANNQIIWKRYPNYRQEVREYMQQAIAAENQVEESLGIRVPRKGKLKSIARKVRSVINKNT